jgi:hypothetical protein
MVLNKNLQVCAHGVIYTACTEIVQGNQYPEHERRTRSTNVQELSVKRTFPSRR